MEAVFIALLDRVRLGDQSAASELVREYEPVVRSEIRLWLRQCRTVSLHRVLDSTDICQSVLARFFERASEDRLNLESPEHLRNLLLVMARNRFLHHLRYNQTPRRDLRRSVATMPADVAEPASRSAPIDQSLERELLALIRSRLTPEELELADRRARGESWAEIVAAMGGTVDGRRVQLARVEIRIATDFGLSGSEGPS